MAPQSNFDLTFPISIQLSQVLKTNDVRLMSFDTFACVRFTSIHREDFICLEELECQGTDQWCCAEDVSFLHQVSSSLI